MISTAKLRREEQPRLASEGETAEYIGDLLAQLERLAQTQGLVKLQYLLKACHEEAERVASA